MENNFTHLHVHTQYSLMEGAIRIKQLAKALKKLDQTACAITDHGNMFGAVEFYHAMKKADLKPIIGLGAYVARGNRKKRDYEFRGPNASQTNLLCQNKEGYKNLIRMASLAYSEGKYYVPRIDHELLEKHNEGLIALSSGQDGELGKKIKFEGLDAGRSLASWYRDVFDGRYYIEIQPPDTPEQTELNDQLIQLAQELSIPLVGTNNCYYLEEEEAYAHYILELMGDQKRITDRDIRPMKPASRYLKDGETIAELLAAFPKEAITNTKIIEEQCELSLDNKDYYLPEFEFPSNHTLDSYFKEAVGEGLEKRLSHLYGLYGVQEPFEEFRKPYDERLEYELGVIIQMKFPGYFLIVAEFINWSKDNGIPVGPGRGSGAGSLVAYSLRITDIDPLAYGLLFERFLNPDRISMPDFDVDFEVSGRDQVIGHVKKKYGENNVCQIATFQSLGAKAAIRSVARVLDFPYAEADKIAKLIPDKIGISLEDSIQQEPELAKMEDTGSENEKKLISLAKSLEGITTHLGTHAAGVIIMDCDIREVMPVCTGKDGSLQSMFTMKYAEDQGAVKFDFLGLLNLSIIDAAIKLINNELPPDQPFDLDTIPMDDQPTFDLFCKGDTTGVFQLESSGMKKLLVDMQPSVFEDIVAILALYRPGPLGSGMVDDFIQCKHGRKAIQYPHPLLESVLKETYGVMVYQEQIMQAVQVLAGFTLGQADLLRRAIGKKIPEILAEQRQNFEEGCTKNPVFVEGCGKIDPAQKANEIFDLIDYFSGYGFNKSHTVAYGYISYQTAYLKANYPVQFMAAVLNCSMTNPDKVVNFIAECKAMGISVLPPDVNQSAKEFTVSKIGYEIDRKNLKKLESDGLSQETISVLSRLEGKRFKTKESFADALRHLEAPNISDHIDLVTTRALVECVRFGLSAVKNVGGNHVDAILEARTQKENQSFEDIMDFMKTIDVTKVNKRVLETLVKCGALDSLNPNRAQNFEILDEAIHLGQEYQRAADPNQNSLFDLLSTEEAQKTETKLVLPNIKDWPTKQYLTLEKESLGFYVTGHPLDRYASEVRKFTISTADLREKPHKENEKVAMSGIVTSKVVRLTKNAEKFAIVKIEDLRGTIEFPIYAKLYSEVAPLLDLEEPIFVEGRVSYRDDEIGLIPDKVMLLSQLREESCLGMIVEITKEKLAEEAVRQVKGAILTSPGEQSVIFKIRAPRNGNLSVHLKEKINLTPQVVEELEEIMRGQEVGYLY